MELGEGFGERGEKKSVGGGKGGGGLGEGGCWGGF